ncbi:DUF2851 family protein [Maribacter cobaltidurans]|uniref:Uncharacterized protein n=1 Tax=Maribacter cobaltidurans TaxID=1178778 RepID=A0A223V8T5_9FLAO|nr:DUF2851 family protein [Maribacter cobaltidurans]ASV31289.1 hypothetical protein CJ263_14285 [Maribacter cobaltidurans]GGD83547.1 hypothetical protein GCM10011412_21600 [Maribacter cobaltidurans]
MREDLLHYIWKYKKYPVQGLKASKGENLTILNSGSHNHLSGPDFFNAQVRIADQLWAGNVEIHVNSSDWYAHNHQEDKNYDNVILHVVWNDDVSVFRADGTEIPTLELKNYIDSQLLGRYQKLMQGQRERFINCGNDINTIPKFDFIHWQERLYLERLEDKSKVILILLEECGQDWEKVLFVLLLKNFGSKINGEAFMQIGLHLDFSIVRHLIGKPLELESLLFGMAGLLESDNSIDSYYGELRKNFQYLRHKFNIDHSIGSASFFKLRPPNFPTIRLSQFATLYGGNNNLFHHLMHCSDDEIFQQFGISASTYWDSHYNFGKTSKGGVKRISKKFVDLLTINTIVPLRFCYQKHKGMAQPERVLGTVQKIKAEKNGIIDSYRNLNIEVNSAWESQSLLQLYNNYCSNNKCLRCVVGTRLLNLKT